MKVLHIGLSKNRGGIETFALSYLKVLKKRDVVFDFVDIYGQGLAGDDVMRELGADIITLPNFKRHPIGAMRALTRCIREGAYDAVHIHIQSAANITTVLAARAAGVTPIIHNHVFSVSGFLRTALHILNLPVVRNTKAYRFACGEDAGRWFWGKKDFAVIPNSVDIDRFSFNAEARKAIREELGVDEATTLLGYVGRLEDVKNPLFALEVIEKCKASYPDRSIKLFVVGDGSLRSALESKLKERGIENDVFLLGYRSNVQDYLSAADVFIMPSLHEAFSIAAIEAQTSGCACLFSDSIPHELAIFDDCYFISLNDVDKWVEHINRTDIKDEAARLTAGEIIKDSRYNIEVSERILYEAYKTARDNEI